MQDDSLNLDTLLDESLRHAPDVLVPEHFSQRVLAALPAEPPPASLPWDLWPEIAAACAPALVGAALWYIGSLAALLNPVVLTAVGAVEMTFAVLWAVRPNESTL